MILDDFNPENFMRALFDVRFLIYAGIDFFFGSQIWLQCIETGCCVKKIVQIFFDDH